MQEAPEQRPTAESAAVVPSRRGNRSLIFLLVALTVECAWLGALGYALYRFLA